MISEKELFWKLFAEEKEKGLGDLSAWSAVCDRMIFMNLKWQSATDAEFEVIPPLMISDKNVQEGEATEDEQGGEDG